MSGDASIPDRLLDDDGRVRVDTPCRRCRYDLRGLDASARCPECDLPLASSLGDDLLVLGDRRWIAGLLQATRLFAVAMGAGILVGLGLTLLINATVVGDALRPYEQILYLGLGFAFMAALGIAYWIFTAPEPGRSHERDGCRRVARIGLLSGLAISLGSSALSTIALGGFGMYFVDLGPFMTATAVMALDRIADLAGIIGWVALTILAVALARRVPDDRFARITLVVLVAHIAMRALSWCHLVANLVIVEMSRSGSTVPPILYDAVVIVQYVTMPGVGVTTVACLVIAVLFARTLRAVLRRWP